MTKGFGRPLGEVLRNVCDVFETTD